MPRHSLNVKHPWTQQRTRDILLLLLISVLVTYIRNEDKMDCVIEAFRVLGNLSRAKKIRDVLIKFKGNEQWRKRVFKIMFPRE